jgi:hypothetical protein
MPVSISRPPETSPDGTSIILGLGDGAQEGSR